MLAVVLALALPVMNACSLYAFFYANAANSTNALTCFKLDIVLSLLLSLLHSSRTIDDIKASFIAMPDTHNI